MRRGEMPGWMVGARLAAGALIAGTVLAIVAALCGGCVGLPAGYDRDLTPDHNGEEWIGGAGGETSPKKAARKTADYTDGPNDLQESAP